jgi:hypothetical protein
MKSSCAGIRSEQDEKKLRANKRRMIIPVTAPPELAPGDLLNLAPLRADKDAGPSVSRAKQYDISVFILSYPPSVVKMKFIFMQNYFFMDHPYLLEVEYFRDGCTMFHKYGSC